MLCTEWGRDLIEQIQCDQLIKDYVRVNKPKGLPHFWNTPAVEGLTLQIKRHLNIFAYISLIIYLP